MSNQLQKGRVFNPGDTVDAIDLNNLVDLAIALPAIIIDSTHAVVGAATGDKALIVRGTGGAAALKQADISTFPSGVTDVTVSVDAGAPYFILTVTAAAGARNINAKFAQTHPHWCLAGPATGAALGNLSLRPLLPSDLNAIVTVPAALIDLDQGSTFYKNITTSSIAMKLVNGTPGQVVKVIMIQGSGSGGHATVSWAPNAVGDFLRWPGGTPPVMSTGPVGTTDIYEFTLLQTGTSPNNYYGIRWGAAFDV